MPQSQRSRPFERLGPSRAESPLVCAVPHAGRNYPPTLLAASAVPHIVLEQLEDRYADLLVEEAVAQGAVAIVARVARALIDLNRGEDDLDPALRDPPNSGPPQSARARSGLGLLPTRIGRRALWQELPTPASAARRIATIHQPYHRAIAEALDDACHRFGHAVLIDCHSMPTLCGVGAARIVIGDGHGRSAGKGVAAAVAQTARKLGLTTALNAPYAGAHSIAHHGRPADNIHALQIEIDRSLYLESDLRTPSAGLQRTRALVTALALCAVRATRPPFAIAAE
ncbi:MAG TPA: N-formylglutamate amidohydrolase [Sphingomonas sp.]|nr:N-formylglutamate amidohydrolase [Sphingomonas sp.]